VGENHLELFKEAIASSGQQLVASFQEVWVRMTEKKIGQNFAIVQEKVQQFLVTCFLFSDFQ
jgi:hypothetical protein